MTNQINDTEVRDLELTIENDSRVYPKRLAIEANMRRKVAAGKYDASKAPAAWMYFVDEGAKLYTRDFPGVRFSRATRLEVARRFAREFEDQIKTELQAAKEGALEEQAVTFQEWSATQTYAAYRRHQTAAKEATRAVNHAAWFVTAIEGAK